MGRSGKTGSAGGGGGGSVGASVAVEVGVSVGVFVGVDVGVSVGVDVGVNVGVGANVGVAVGVLVIFTRSTWANGSGAPDEKALEIVGVPYQANNITSSSVPMTKIGIIGPANNGLVLVNAVADDC